MVGLFCSKISESMAFDIDKLFADCMAKIQQFAAKHPDETFYGFAIDANMLCLNSNERFAQSLKEHQSRWIDHSRIIEALEIQIEERLRNQSLESSFFEKQESLDGPDKKAVWQHFYDHLSKRRSEGNPYMREEEINSLRANPGDWAYRNFAGMEVESGFDDDLYNEHYYAAMESDDGHAPHTEYAIAMTELVDRLRRSDAFETLKRTDDFVVTWVDHDY